MTMHWTTQLRFLAAAASSLLLGGCMATTADTAPQVIASNAADTHGEPAAIEQRIDALLAAMSVEQKVGQVIMPDISTISPDDVRRFGFGTILNGGNSGPGGNERAPAAQWLALADAFWDASTAARDDGRPAIPVLWATDAVHGHNNVVGATIFPHNVGLGATGNADLVRRIGEATAAEIAATGIDWTFAPTIAVARDDRWGRTYESYGEDPALVSRLGAAMVEGLQGRAGSDDFLSPRHVLATAKHFFGDGGTGGRDQGDTLGDEAALIALHAAPYPASIDAGVQTVMASFSSINGVKMHGNETFLTGLLRREMGFDGLVVGDWNGHGQLPGCTNSNCPQALLAGLDIYMVPEDWRALHATLLTQLADGTIPMTRLDEAVRRILRVKLRMGLFERGRPSSRPLAIQPGQLGHADHRALARQAVRESLVLLSNRGSLLPLDPRSRILVTGPGANSIAMQSGGWTISWQGGGDLTNDDFPGAQSIWAGLSEQIVAAGGQAELSVDGRYDTRPDVAIVIFGEPPYAEFSGDRTSLQFDDASSLSTMRRLKADGIPVVAIFLSGRPMWVNAEINTADAFVAAWLPGSEGGGVADLLLRDRSGGIQHEFSGRLAMSWPARCDQFENNAGTANYAPLFALGFGHRYADGALAQPALDERCAFAAAGRVPLVRAGAAVGGRSVALVAADGRRIDLLASRGVSPDGNLSVTPQDWQAQEDARQLRWTGAASWHLGSDALIDLPPPGAGREWALEWVYAVSLRPAGRVLLDCGSGCSAPVDMTAAMALAEGKGWRTLTLPLRCMGSALASGGQGTLPLRLNSASGFTMSLSSLEIVSVPTDAACHF